MNNNENSEQLIRQLSFDNLIWGVYLLIAIANIYGDELIKLAIRTNDREPSNRAQKIFLTILVITLIINIYFFTRNYRDLKNDCDNESLQIRFVGSGLLILATLCFIYSQTKNKTPTESVSNV